MNEGKDRAQWWHTSAVVATIANQNRKKGRKAFESRDAHPWEVADRKKWKRRPTAPITILRDVFVNGKGFSEIEKEYDL